MVGWPVELAAAALVATFAYAAGSDWRTREASDRLWQGLTVTGIVLGSVTLAPLGPLALGVWILVGALALEHLFPWDRWIESWGDHAADLVEVVAFLGVLFGLVLVGLGFGVGSSGPPLPVLEAFVGITLARGLYELRLLYGGADAKALIAASVTLPLGIAPLLPLPPSALTILAIYPFPLTLLMNAAILAIVIPIALAIRNAHRHEFAFPRGFTGYSIPVSELPDRFVWLKDPEPPEEAGPEREAETSDEDRAIRRRQRDVLQARGIERAWVSPQIPFLVLMLAGVVAGLLFGNLIFDLLALL